MNDNASKITLNRSLHSWGERKHSSDFLKMYVFIIASRGAFFLISFQVSWRTGSGRGFGFVVIETKQMGEIGGTGGVKVFLGLRGFLGKYSR